MVNPELQIFKCFGCGESGDVFSFLEKNEGMEFYEALKYVADKVGAVLQKSDHAPKDDKQRLYEVNNLVHRFYQYMLLHHEKGRDGLEYLKKRGITMETITTFQLGFAPNDYSALEKVLVSKKKATAKELESLGLVFMRNSRGTDRFRGRIMFPLFDHRGNLCGFAGRILPQFDNKETGKYINSPETALYHKSHMLYGLLETKRDIKSQKFAIVVEGEMDVLASWQAGIKNVCAIKGSALTQEQVKLISRFTKKIIFCLDTDFAGDAAARRGIQIAENEGLEIRVAQLIGYKDPGEAAVADPKAYKRAITEAVGVWDFIIDSVFKKYKTSDGENKAKISRELVPLLATIQDSIIRAHYVGITAQKLSVPIDAVESEIGKKEKPVPSVTTHVDTDVRRNKSRRDILEERLLSIAFTQDPGFLVRHDDISQKIENPLYKRILKEFYTFAYGTSDLQMAAFVQEISPELKEVFSNLMLLDWNDLDKRSEEEYTTELSRLLGELELLMLRGQLDQLAAEIKVAHGSDKKQKLLQAQKLFPKLQQLQKSVENR